MSFLRVLSKNGIIFITLSRIFIEVTLISPAILLVFKLAAARVVKFIFGPLSSNLSVVICPFQALNLPENV